MKRRVQSWPGARQENRCSLCLVFRIGHIVFSMERERRRRQLPTTKLRTWVLVCLVGSLVSSPPLSRLHQRKRYSREEVDGVRKEKERLTTDHQPREIIDGRLTCLFLTLSFPTDIYAEGKGKTNLWENNVAFRWARCNVGLSPSELEGDFSFPSAFVLSFGSATFHPLLRPPLFLLDEHRKG